MTKPLRILVVDDNQTMAETLKDIFMVKGYQAEEAITVLDKPLDIDLLLNFLSSLTWNDMS